jgi:hypothetical protein
MIPAEIKPTLAIPPTIPPTRGKKLGDAPCAWLEDVDTTEPLPATVNSGVGAIDGPDNTKEVGIINLVVDIVNCDDESGGAVLLDHAGSSS